uniref:Uncharacterized protein n=1 Tax=Aegilops tauschii subsp. strangulata TaxID=200361 RepID=A0A453JAZ6_AEGTS
MWNPLSWVMEAAAIMAIALAHDGKDLRGRVTYYCSYCHRRLYAVTSMLPWSHTNYELQLALTQPMGIDYHDFVGIVILLVVNSTISFVEENNAGNAAAALMARLAPKAKVISTYIYSFLQILPTSTTSTQGSSYMAGAPFFSYLCVTFFCRLCVMAPGMS